MMISYDVVSFDAPLARHERETPVPVGAEVLLKVAAAGVCHSDVHVRAGGYDLGGGKRLRMGERGVALPLTLGHEIVGDVVAVGPDANPALVGQRSLVYPWLGCGTCALCASGREQMCTKPRSLGIFRPGGYSDHVLVPHPRYLIDVADMPPEQAAPLACSGLTTYSALRRFDADVLRSTPIVVIGAGGLGMMCVRLVKALGGAGAIVVDLDATRREAALAAGALAAFDPAQPDVVRDIVAAAGGTVLGAIDLVGASSTAKLGLDVLSKGGRLLLIGLAGGDLNLALPLMPLRVVSIEGCYVGSLPELRELVALVRQTRLPPFPTRCRALHEAEDALRDLEEGRFVGRFVLQP